MLTVQDREQMDELQRVHGLCHKLIEARRQSLLAVLGSDVMASASLPRLVAIAARACRSASPVRSARSRFSSACIAG